MHRARHLRAAPRIRFPLPTGQMQGQTMQVIHDPDHHRFRVQFGAYEACLLYARHDNVLDFYHIYVPDPYRGQGIAGLILRTAFDYARAEGLEVVASCSFIAGDFLPRHPAYHDLVRQGSFPFA